MNSPTEFQARRTPKSTAILKPTYSVENRCNTCVREDFLG
jgi:hypothetical protein